MFFIEPARLAPANYPPFVTIFYSVAVTFFAYEGFRIVTNTAEDIPDPARNLPRAIMTAIVLVMLVYIGIALAVFGNLPPERVVATQEFALAEAARPILGQTGFAIVAVTALVATASAINASLYAVTNVTYQLAREGELPEAFGEPIGHSREGLIISSAIIIFLSLFFDLSEIAAIGALSMLIIHMVTHIAHLKLLPETGARRGPILLAIALNGTAVVLGGYHLGKVSPGLFVWIAGFFLLAFGLEYSFHQLSKRSVQARTRDENTRQAMVRG
jgi:amino acid transporter